MKWLRTIGREFCGLFIEDGRFAVAILAWLSLMWILHPHLSLPTGWRAPLLLIGLLAILFESVLRRSRQR